MSTIAYAFPKEMRVRSIQYLNGINTTEVTRILEEIIGESITVTENKCDSYDLVVTTEDGTPITKVKNGDWVLKSSMADLQKRIIEQAELFVQKLQEIEKCFESNQGTIIAREDFCDIFDHRRI
jgi:hypothetical protein